MTEREQLVERFESAAAIYGRSPTPGNRDIYDQRRVDLLAAIDALTEPAGSAEVMEPIATNAALLLAQMKTVFAGDALPHWQLRQETTALRGKWLDRIDGYLFIYENAQRALAAKPSPAAPSSEAQAWIPVGERLPAYGDVVTVFCEDWGPHAYGFAAKRLKGLGWWDVRADKLLGNSVSHWRMPLPAAPAKGKP